MENPWCAKNKIFPDLKVKIKLSHIKPGGGETIPMIFHQKIYFAVPANGQNLP